MLRTRFTEIFDLRHPIMSAPMAMHSGATLAAAVSAAGGLGSFGGINIAGPDWVDAQITGVRESTDRPFAVGFITPFLTFAEPLLALTLERGVAAVVLSFGDPAPWVPRIADSGARVLCQVQTLDDADTAVEAGADVLIVQGTEAGGHTGTLGLLPLLTAVAERHPDIPLLAAGGITDGRSLAAVLVAGADGAVLGTAFLATPEAVEVHDTYKDLIVASDGSDTIHTRAYDIASGLPWPPSVGERVRRNRFTDEWHHREDELEALRGTPDAPDPFPSDPPRPDVDAIAYGQGAGSIRAIRPAETVLTEICADAAEILRDRPSRVVGEP